MRYNTGTWHFSGVAFVGLYNHRGVNVADPVLGRFAYMQNIARASSRGAEIKMDKDVAKMISVFAGASRHKFMLTENIVAVTNTVTPAKGKQVPDVPGYDAMMGI
jgi:iron complex outermembrane recepter protein